MPEISKRKPKDSPHLFKGPPSDVSNLTDLIGYANHRILSDQDFAWIITGDVGNGKSTLAFLFNTSSLAAWSFSLDQGLAFTGPQYIQNSLDAPRRSAHWLDEPVRSGMNRSWASPENKDVQKHMVWIRAKNQVHTHLHPDRGWADKLLRSTRFHAWLHIHRLGHGRLRFPKKHSDFQKEAWWGPTEGIPIKFVRATGPMWEEYQRRKDALEKRRHEIYDTVGVNLGMIEGVPPAIVLEMAQQLRPRIRQVAQRMRDYEPEPGTHNRGPPKTKPWLKGHRW